MLTRPPHPALRPFVSAVWTSSGAAGDAAIAGVARERVLPTGTVHVVFRGDGDPLRVFDDVDDRLGRTIGCALVGGPRASYYVRDVARPADSVGAMLHPGVAPLLFGLPAADLADRHVALDELWGPGAEEARARIMTARGPAARLEALERELRARLPTVRGIHPAVATALACFADGGAVGDAVDASGYSHRHFIALFRDAVGLTPKVYGRVLRFGRVLAVLAGRPAIPWAEVAGHAGYADQPHFVREFRAFAGVAPGQYRASSVREAHHLPILHDPGQIPARRSGDRQAR